MPKEETKIEFCTSCGSKEIEVTGNKFYCPVCDVTYSVSKAGTKPIDTDPLGKHKARLDQIEKDVADLKGTKAVVEMQPVDTKTDSIEDEEEPQGFIRIEDQ